MATRRAAVAARKAATGETGRGASPEPPSAEGLLQRARLARTSGQREAWARRGLDSSLRPDDVTRALLLRQLYLAHFERHRFAEARAIAEEMAGMRGLDDLRDVALQDAARACIAVGDLDAAVEHLRQAGRVAPRARQPFHVWSLGCLHYYRGHPELAIGCFERARRWDDSHRALHGALLELARRAAGHPPEVALAELQATLQASADGAGQVELVLGEIAQLAGEHAVTVDRLATYLTRLRQGRVALRKGLELERRHARRLLARSRAALRRAAR